ncbi:hypothetical protein BH11MYX1_BH11MYX1_15270 [soil metagenome]
MIREVEGGVILEVLVQPRASRAKLGPVHDGRLKVAVTAPPVDGEANAAVVAFVAKQLGLARGAVEVVAGESSRRKSLRIAISRGALAAVLGMGCTASVGTIDVSLVTAPGSTVMTNVATLRFVLTDPRIEQTANRGSDGTFKLDVQFDATDTQGAIIVDGMDANGIVIANGATPPFPLNGASASVAVYMAAPNSIAAAPTVLTPARSAVGTAALSYGVVFAGGLRGDGTTSDATAIYNAFDHTLTAGIALPAPRSGLAVGLGSRGAYVYTFGGSDSSGVATDTLARFDITVSPAGAITDLGSFSGLARSGQTAISVGDENLLVTGTPAATINGNALTVTARDGIASLPASGAAVTGSDGVAAAIFADASGVTRFRKNQFDTLDLPMAARDGASVATLAGGKVGVMCGGPDLIRIDAAAGTAETFPSLPIEPRTGCAVASTTRYLVIAGGSNAVGVVPTVEIYDAASLALVATQPLVVPRTRATATPLRNGQILIAGGLDATGTPIETLELFTPDSAE